MHRVRRAPGLADRRAVRGPGHQRRRAREPPGRAAPQGSRARPALRCAARDGPVAPVALAAAICRKMIDRLTAKGVRVVGVQDGYDTARKGHKMQAGLSGIIGEAFREMVKDRTYAALESRAKAEASDRWARLRLSRRDRSTRARHSWCGDLRQVRRRGIVRARLRPTSTRGAFRRPAQAGTARSGGPAVGWGQASA